MRALSLALAACVTMTPAFAQNWPAQSAGPTKHHFQLSGEIMEDPSADAFLIETRQGGRVASAELDVCYSASPASTRKDRFVVQLAAEGGRLVGSGTSQEEKQPITVRLTRQANGSTVAYEGVITRDGKSAEFTSQDNSAIAEDEFRNSQASDSNLVPEPKEFTEVSPELIIVQVERPAFAAILHLLRGESVRVALDTLSPDCGALRAGRQFIRLDVDPQRAAVLVSKLRGQSGVVKVGWTVGSYSLDNAVAFDPAAWPGVEGREKLIAAAAPAIAKFLKAQADTSTAEPASGVTTLRFKRPNTTVPGLTLTDTIEVPVTTGPDRPAGGKNLLLWIGGLSAATADTGPEPRLGILTSSGSEGEASGDNVDATGLAAAIALELKGRVWDFRNDKLEVAGPILHAPQGYRL